MLTSIKCNVSIRLKNAPFIIMPILWTQLPQHWFKPFRQKCDKHAALERHKHGTDVIGMKQRRETCVAEVRDKCDPSVRLPQCLLMQTLPVISPSSRNSKICSKTLSQSLIINVRRQCDTSVKRVRQSAGTNVIHVEDQCETCATLAYSTNLAFYTIRRLSPYQYDAFMVLT